MGDFRKLEVWQRARLLSVRVYQITGKFPSRECFGITAQMRTTSVCIVSSLSEGSGRNQDGVAGNFLERAQGSAAKLECQALLSRDLGYLTDAEAGEVLAEVTTVRRMLGHLTQRTKAARNGATRSPRSAKGG